MKEKPTQNLSQTDLDDLIHESVENAVSRRQPQLDLDDHLIDISTQDAKNIKGGRPLGHTCGMICEVNLM